MELFVVAVIVIATLTVAERLWQRRSGRDHPEEFAWRGFAEAAGGRLDIDRRRWGILGDRKLKVVAPVGNTSLTVDTALAPEKAAASRPG